MRSNPPSESTDPRSGPLPLQLLASTFRNASLEGRNTTLMARDLKLPVASVRGAQSWYSDLHSDPHSIRVCVGTSCLLAGGDKLATSLAIQHNCRPVHCLGYCDRSPALLLPDHTVVAGCNSHMGSTHSSMVEGQSAVSQPAATDVRCAARTAIATARLSAGGSADLSLARRLGAYESITNALKASPGKVLAAVEHSGIRGRGGAGFPTGRKWRKCAESSGDYRYVIANGDEGDPGSFIDRELMERDPHGILEGMILAAHAIGACRGIVFIRSEYPRAFACMRSAVDQAYAAGLLGKSVGGTAMSFDVQVVQGLGGYVCGEETALLNALEGQRGEARPRPPYPASEGLFGRPTVVDNVETLVNIPWIVQHGAAAYRAMGTSGSPGTKVLCLNHGFARPGIVEVEFGTPLRQVIDELAGGVAAVRKLESILLGGPMGSVVDPAEWDVPICIDAMAKRGIRLGHGGMVAIPDATNYSTLLHHLLEFMKEESCGKCVPCRVGTLRAFELARTERPLATEFAKVLNIMEQASLCGFGRETPGPVRQLMEKIREVEQRRPRT